MKKIYSKKISYIFSKIRFSYISRNRTFQAQKIKKKTGSKESYIFSKNIFIYFGKWNFVAPRLKKSLYFLKTKTFLIFQETELSSLKIQKFQEGTLWGRKVKKSTRKIFFPKKVFLIFQKGICRAWKTKICNILGCLMITLC